MSNINHTKHRGSTRGFRKENSPCSVSGTRHETIVKKKVIGQYKRKKDVIVTMAEDYTVSVVTYDTDIPSSVG